MPNVRLREGESFDSAVRRFKRIVEKAGIPKELRRREFHQKGSTIRKRKAAAAKKRFMKKMLRDQFGAPPAPGARSSPRGGPAHGAAAARGGARGGSHGGRSDERRGG